MEEWGQSGGIFTDGKVACVSLVLMCTPVSPYLAGVLAGLNPGSWPFLARVMLFL